MAPSVAVSGASVRRSTSAWWIPVWVLSALASLGVALVTQGSLFLVSQDHPAWWGPWVFFWLWPTVWLLMTPVGVTHFVLVCTRRASVMRRRLLIAQVVAMSLYQVTSWGLFAAVGLTEGFYAA
ncbi:MULTISPECIES: hypothetical protein [Nocardiopsis]|uniref:Uncharacterized protein n=1 Tax=Nocardiopsis alba TaxID=53437 RepID=A0A7K2IM37_9ACTN|nr:MULTISPECIES: hypothetical protein [Nocardiopsis]MEC3894573.1 hypothetical protein [Nocardiopsis sp. LDBS1602]MYR31058.1 hypothetical protein [Nocardiopsis alba]